MKSSSCGNRKNDLIKSYYEVKTQWKKNYAKNISQISSQDSLENIGTEKVGEETGWFTG